MRKILIVVDMQNDFVTGSLGTPESQAIVPRVAEKVKKCRDDGYNIFFTQDTHFDYYLDTLEGKYLPIKHCIAGTSGWDIIPEIAEFTDGTRIVEKETFGFDDWDVYFNYDHQFELIGLCTDICVVSNALILRAQFPNSEIIIHADCCAGTTPEKHAAALEVMKSCQIQVKGE